VVPFVLVFLGVVVFLLFAMQGTWIGQLMRQAPVQEDPIAKMSFSDARTIIDSKIQENLAAVGAKNSKVTWHNPSSAPQASGQVDDRAVDAPIELTIDTTLPTPDVRKQVVDPIKPYMEKAKLYTLSMNDAKSHAHWTYTMTPGVTPSDADE